MSHGPRLAFYALMWSGTAAACVLLTALYFAWKGEALPRVPVRVTGDWLIDGDDEIGFVPVRNGVTEMQHLDANLRYHVFTDGRRARVDRPGAETPERVDVVAVGCSFTWGTGVESEDTYPRQLGRMLGVSVANFAMGSYGSVQSFQLLRRHADLRPKVVVYGFIQDHVRRNVSPCAPNYVPYCLPVSYVTRADGQVVLQRPHMEYFSPEDNRAFIAEVAMRDPAGVFAWLVAAKWAAKIAWFNYRNADTIAVDRSVGTATAALAAMIDAMVTEADAIGARLVVLNMPYLPRGHVQALPETLRAAVAGKDLTVVDFSPVAAAYYERHPAETLTLGSDPHPSPAAHRLIAETLAPVVQPLVASARDSR